MDQTLNRIAESLTFLLAQRDPGDCEGGGGGGGGVTVRQGRTCNVLPSQDSLPSYDQLSSSPSPLSSNTAAGPHHPSREENCWDQDVFLFLKQFIKCIQIKLSYLLIYLSVRQLPKMLIKVSIMTWFRLIDIYLLYLFFRKT